MANYTKDQVNKMTSEKYKDALNNDPDFRVFVDTGMSEQPVARTAVPTGTSTARDRAQLVARKAEGGFDPSFDELPTPPAAAAAAAVAVLEPPVEDVAPAVVVTAPVTVVPVEFVREYQPVDAQGHPRGGKQVFKGKSAEEVLDKVIAAHKAASEEIHRLREAKIMESTEVPADATVSGPLAMRPVLTAEERESWEEKKQDIATAAQAQYMLDRDDDRQVTNGLVRQNFENSVLLALESFKNRNRDYTPSKENATKLVGYISRRGLDPTDVRNYQKAYDVLRESNLITSANQSSVAELASETPIVREEKTVPNTQVPVVEPARISEATPPQATRPVAQIPTGLSNTDSLSEGETTAKSILDAFEYRHIFKDSAGKPTGVVKTFQREKAYQNMPSEMYKHYLEEDKRSKRIKGTGNGFPEWCEACEAKITADHAALRRSR